MSNTFLWCCLFFNFAQLVVWEHLLLLDLALSGVNGLSSFAKTEQDQDSNLEVRYLRLFKVLAYLKPRLLHYLKF